MDDRDAVTNDVARSGQLALVAKCRVRRAGNERRFRVLAVVDDFTREYLGLVVDASLCGLQASRELDRIVEWRDCHSAMVVSENGMELTSHAILRWQEKRSVLQHHIAPYKRQQSGIAESLNGRFHDECLNAYIFSSLVAARRIIKTRRTDYDTGRLYTDLGKLIPAVFATRLSPGHRRGGLCS